jgi:uncharacterized protein
MTVKGGSMSEVSTYPPGAFCWVELATTDLAAAKGFYGTLLGWDTRDETVAPGATYTTVRVDGKSVGGMYAMSRPDAEAGHPARWLSYVSVANVDDTANRAAGLGSKLVVAPSEVSDLGRMAVIEDPEGARLALWQARRHIGAAVVNQPGAVCWTELTARDAVKAADFYASLFGWTPKVAGSGPEGYTEIYVRSIPIGGILTMNNQPPDAPAEWTPYFVVTDCDAGAGKSGAAGGRVEYGPADIPNVGRFAWLRDPQGARFAIIQLRS